jgi:16S rRNA (guanine1207-N2)-methyltransferase
MAEDVYFKKEVTFPYGGQVLRLRVSQDLFSSQDVDVGTKRLLRSLLSQNFGAIRKVLDLGCGYGPIGLTLKGVDAGRIVHMVDRDALAIEYSRQNAELNQLSGVEIYGSLGYADVTSCDFDLIVSNIPAKAGESAISYFLRDAVYYLRPGGLVAIVVVTPLESTVERIIDRDDIRIDFRKSWQGHTVFHYHFLEEPVKRIRTREDALDLRVYERGRMNFSIRDMQVPMQTVYGLSEFDTLSYQTQLLLETVLNLQDMSATRAVIMNPGQGHVAAALWRSFRPATIDVVDRDLLALRVTKNNLIANGCSPNQITLFHQVGVLLGGHEQADFIVGALREDEGPEVHALIVKQAAQQLLPDGTIVLASGTTASMRLEAVIRSKKLLRIGGRKRAKGSDVLVLKGY